jgi:hypothetical protein
MSNNLLSGVKLFYSSAKEWMWNYCVYLGPFTDSQGRNFDLGVFMGDFESFGWVSAAIVYADEPGRYISGALRNTEGENMEHYTETWNRARTLELIK